MAHKAKKRAIALLIIASLMVGSTSYAFPENKILRDITATPGDPSTEDKTETKTDDTTEKKTGDESSTEKGSEDGSTSEEGATITVPGQTIAYTTSQTVILTEEQLRAIYGKEYDTKKSNLENALMFLNKLKEGQNSFMQEMIELDEMILAYNDKIEALDAQQAEISQLIAETQASLDTAREVENHQNEVIKSHIKNSYENGNYGLMEVLINAESFSDFLNKSEYVNAVNIYDRRLLEQYAETRKTVANKYAMLTTMQEDTTKLMDEYTDSQAALQVLADAKEEQVLTYESDIKYAKTEYEKLQTDLEAMLVKVETSTTYVYVGPAFITTGLTAGKFQWPCPSSTRITSGFGGRAAPMAGASTYHRGIDIGAEMGAPVIAAADGMVISVGYMGSGGNTVMIDHGNTVVTVYHHLSGYATEEGKVVKKGEVIGFVGSTGVSTGPHLHFGVRIGGNYIDPLTYFK